MRGVALGYELAGKKTERSDVSDRMAENRKMPVEIPNHGVPFLKGKFTGDRRAAGRKNRELDLRHTPLSPHERKSFNSVH